MNGQAPNDFLVIIMWDRDGGPWCQLQTNFMEVWTFAGHS